MTVGPNSFLQSEAYGSGLTMSCQANGEEASHHYHHQSWMVGNKKLTSVQIWRSDMMTLSAIQLVAVGQT